MLPLDRVRAGAGLFFGQILTGRQLLTRRPRADGIALLAAGGLVGLVLGGSGATYLGRATAIQPLPRRAPEPPPLLHPTLSTGKPLVVHVRRVSQAGPERLLQRFTGIVTARRTTQLAAKALGRVERVAVDIGDAVVAGQILVALDREQLLSQRDGVEANRKAAQAKLEELQRGPRPEELAQAAARVDELRSQVQLQQANWQRTAALRNSSALSPQELDESRYRTAALEAQLKSAEEALQLLRVGTRSEQLAAQQSAVDGLAAQLASVEIQLAETLIAAPYDGHVQLRRVDEGQVVSAGQPLLEVVETGALEVHVGLPVELTYALTDGEISARYQQKTLATQLVQVSPTVNSATRTREVVLSLNGSSYQHLAVGTAVEVEVAQRPECQGVWVPTAALTSAERGLWAVFIAQPVQPADLSEAGTAATAAEATAAAHRIERRPVELLRSHGEWCEVRGTVSASELLVVDGVHRIVAGQLVQIADNHPPRGPRP